MRLLYMHALRCKVLVDDDDDDICILIQLCSSVLRNIFILCTPIVFGVCALG